MNQLAPNQGTDRAIEDALADELAQSDRTLTTIAPVLGHLLRNDDHALFSDEVLARVRGMVADLARHFALAEARSAGICDMQHHLQLRVSAIATDLAGNRSLLAHCHALALEWQLALRLEAERALDPVLSPLIQALTASDEGSTAALGMKALAAQARFVQGQRRMELPLGELPAEVFHAALQAWRTGAGPSTSPAHNAAETSLREAFDEGSSRLALFERLVVAMGGGVTAALSIQHAGVALFLSAMAAASGQPRERVCISTNERHAARFALALRATGLKQQSVEEQLVYLHSNAPLPPGACSIAPDRAAAMLDTAWNGA